MMSLTFVAESCLVLSKPLEPHALADDVEELVEGGPALLVVVHLLLRLLPGAAVHDAHLGAVFNNLPHNWAPFHILCHSQGPRKNEQDYFPPSKNRYFCQASKSQVIGKNRRNI